MNYNSPLYPGQQNLQKYFAPESYGDNKVGSFH